MADEKKDEAGTVTATDALGEEFEVEVGIDGKNPVSINNPPKGAILGPPPDPKVLVVNQDNAAPSADEQREIEGREKKAAEESDKDEADTAEKTSAPAKKTSSSAKK